MKRFDLKAIMSGAWKLYKKSGKLSFGVCLHMAWQMAKAAPINAERIEKAKAEAGVTEQTETWSGWKALGYEVIHGSKALFQSVLIWASKGEGVTYKASFFGASQVQAIA